MKYPCGNCKEVREKDYYGYIGICDKCKKRIEYFFSFFKQKTAYEIQV